MCHLEGLSCTHGLLPAPLRTCNCDRRECKPTCSCCICTLQEEHSLLLQQVQQLESLRRENAEMAGLVAQLAVLRKDQAQLHELCEQVELLREDNGVLRNKSQRLPALQEENQRLQVGWDWRLCCACLRLQLLHTQGQ